MAAHERQPRAQLPGAPPFEAELQQRADESAKVLQCIKVTLLATLNGYAPAIAIETAEIVREHESYQKGLMWTLANHRRVPQKVRDEMGLSNVKLMVPFCRTVDEGKRVMAEMEKTRSCGACHTGIKAFSVADEKACGRCHAGKPRIVTYKPKGATEAVFSHAVHIAKTGGKCKSCHNGKVITGKEKNVTMAAMEKGKSCGACHEGKTAFSISKCTVCHPTKDRDYPIKGAGTVRFDHKTHLGSYGCKDCHAKLYPLGARKKVHTMATMNSGKSCGGCHNDSIAFTVRGNCATCHKVS